MKKAGAQIGSSLWRPIFTHPYFSTALSRLPFDGNSGILTHIGEIFVTRNASLWSRDEVCGEAVLTCTTTPIRTLITPIFTYPLSLVCGEQLDGIGPDNNTNNNNNPNSTFTTLLIRCIVGWHYRRKSCCPCWMLMLILCTAPWPCRRIYTPIYRHPLRPLPMERAPPPVTTTTTPNLLPV